MSTTTEGPPKGARAGNQRRIPDELAAQIGDLTEIRELEVQLAASRAFLDKYQDVEAALLEVITAERVALDDELREVGRRGRGSVGAAGSPNI